MLCRLCLKDSINVENIITSDFKCAELNLIESLYWIFGVEVDVNDLYSKFICKRCQNVIQYVGSYRTLYQRNQLILEGNIDDLDKHEEWMNQLNEFDKIRNGFEPGRKDTSTYQLVISLTRLEQSKILDNFEKISNELYKEKADLVEETSQKQNNGVSKTATLQSQVSPERRSIQQIGYLKRYYGTSTTAIKELIKNKSSDMDNQKKCSNVTVSSEEKERLLLVNKNVNVKVCQYCGKKFTTKHHLDLHYHSQHSQNTRKLMICRKKFAQQLKNWRQARLKHYKLRMLISQLTVGKGKKQFLFNFKKFNMLRKRGHKQKQNQAEGSCPRKEIGENKVPSANENLSIEQSETDFHETENYEENKNVTLSHESRLAVPKTIYQQNKRLHLKDLYVRLEPCNISQFLHSPVISKELIINLETVRRDTCQNTSVNDIEAVGEIDKWKDSISTTLHELQHVELNKVITPQNKDQETLETVSDDKSEHENTEMEKPLETYNTVEISQQKENKSIVSNKIQPDSNRESNMENDKLESTLELTQMQKMKICMKEALQKILQINEKTEEQEMEKTENQSVIQKEREALPKNKTPINRKTKKKRKYTYLKQKYLKAARMKRKHLSKETNTNFTNITTVEQKIVKDPPEDIVQNQETNCNEESEGTFELGVDDYVGSEDVDLDDSNVEVETEKSAEYLQTTSERHNASSNSVEEDKNVPIISVTVDSKGKSVKDQYRWLNLKDFNICLVKFATPNNNSPNMDTMKRKLEETETEIENPKKHCPAQKMNMNIWKQNLSETLLKFQKIKAKTLINQEMIPSDVLGLLIKDQTFLKNNICPQASERDIPVDNPKDLNCSGSGVYSMENDPSIEESGIESVDAESINQSVEVHPQDKIKSITVSNSSLLENDQNVLKHINDPYKWIQLKHFHIPLENCEVPQILDSSKVIPTEDQLLKKSYLAENLGIQEQNEITPVSSAVEEDTDGESHLRCSKKLTIGSNNASIENNCNSMDKEMEESANIPKIKTSSVSCLSGTGEMNEMSNKDNERTTLLKLQLINAEKGIWQKTPIVLNSNGTANNYGIAESQKSECLSQTAALVVQISDEGILDTDSQANPAIVSPVEARDQELTSDYEDECSETQIKSVKIGVDPSSQKNTMREQNKRLNLKDFCVSATKSSVPPCYSGLYQNVEILEENIARSTSDILKKRTPRRPKKYEDGIDDMKIKLSDTKLPRRKRGIPPSQINQNVINEINIDNLRNNLLGRKRRGRSRKNSCDNIMNEWNKDISDTLNTFEVIKDNALLSQESRTVEIIPPIKIIRRQSFSGTNSSDYDRTIHMLESNKNKSVNINSPQSREEHPLKEIRPTTDSVNCHKDMNVDSLDDNSLLGNDKEKLRKIHERKEKISALLLKLQEIKQIKMKQKRKNLEIMQNQEVNQNMEDPRGLNESNQICSKDEQNLNRNSNTNQILTSEHMPQLERVVDVKTSSLVENEAPHLTPELDEVDEIDVPPTRNELEEFSDNHILEINQAGLSTNTSNAKNKKNTSEPKQIVDYQLQSKEHETEFPTTRIRRSKSLKKSCKSRKKSEENNTAEERELLSKNVEKICELLTDFKIMDNNKNSATKDSTYFDNEETSQSDKSTYCNKDYQNLVAEPPQKNLLKQKNTLDRSNRRRKNARISRKNQNLSEHTILNSKNTELQKITESLPTEKDISHPPNRYSLNSNSVSVNSHLDSDNSEVKLKNWKANISGALSKLLKIKYNEKMRTKLIGEKE